MNDGGFLATFRKRRMPKVIGGVGAPAHVNPVTRVQMLQDWAHINANHLDEPQVVIGSPIGEHRFRGGHECRLDDGSFGNGKNVARATLVISSKGSGGGGRRIRRRSGAIGRARTTTCGTEGRIVHIKLL